MTWGDVLHKAIAACRAGGIDRPADDDLVSAARKIIEGASHEESESGEQAA